MQLRALFSRFDFGREALKRVRTPSQTREDLVVSNLTS